MSMSDRCQESPVLHVVVVGFHHKKGCQVPSLKYSAISQSSYNILILPDYSTVHHQLTFAISVLQSMYKTCDKIFILLNMRYNFKLTDKWQPEFTCKHLPWWVENMIIYVEQVEQLEWHYPHKLLHKVRQKTAQVSNKCQV